MTEHGMTVVYPVHLDRWTSPVATLLREIARNAGDGSFFSFSSPLTAEDAEMSTRLWGGRISRIGARDLLLRRFDVVHHASSTWRNLTATWMCRARGRSRTRHVFTANVEPYPEDANLRQYDLSVRSAHVVVAVSSAVARALERRHSRTPDAVIPNGVDLDFFDRARANATSAAEAGIRSPFVLFVGVLERRKRPDLVLDLASDLPDIQFVLVGAARGPFAPHVLTRASSLPNVRWVGARSRAEVRDLMSAASALVFPSEVEGLPLTVVEAAAMGLPVLAQPRSSLPEVVVPGRTGWLVPGEDVQEWRRLVEMLCGWGPEAKSMFAETSRATVAGQYSWRSVARRYVRVYAEG